MNTFHQTSILWVKKISRLLIAVCMPLIGTTSARGQCAASCDADEVEVTFIVKKPETNSDVDLLSCKITLAGKSAGIGQELKVKLKKGQEYSMTADARFFKLNESSPTSHAVLECPCGIQVKSASSSYGWSTGNYDLGFHAFTDEERDWIATDTEDIKVRIKPNSKSNRGSDDPDSDPNNPGSSSHTSSAPGQSHVDDGMQIVQSGSVVTSLIPLGYQSQPEGGYVEAGYLSMSHTLGNLKPSVSSFQLRSFFQNVAQPTEGSVRWVSPDPNMNPRILVAEEMVARVQNTPNGVEVCAFPVASFNAANSSFTGEPISRYLFECPVPGGKLVVDEWIGGEQSPTHHREYALSGTALVETSGGTRSEATEIQSLNCDNDAQIRASTRFSYRSEYRTGTGGDEVCISMTVDEYRYIPIHEILTSPNGDRALGPLVRVDEVLVSRRQDLDGDMGTFDGPTDAWEYYGQAADVSLDRYDLMGREKLQISSGGGWTLTGYDVNGNTEVVIEPWLSADVPVGVGIVTPSTLVGGESRMTVFTREFSTGTTSTTRKTYWVSGQNLKLIGESTGTTSSSSSGSDSESISYDQRTVTHTKEVNGSWAPGSGNALAEFNVTSGVATHTMRITTKGTSESTAFDHAGGFYLVPGGSTQEITVSDGNGVVLRETRILPAGVAEGVVPDAAFDPATRETYSYDDKGRQSHVYRDGRLVGTTTYPDRFTTISTDESGIETTTVVDASDRVVSVVTAAGGGVPAITNTTEYDGLETRSYLNGVLVSRSIVDRAGRAVLQEDQTGAVTIWAYSADGRQTTETRPGNVQLTTTTHRDGRPDSSTGSGAIHRFYEYGVEPDADGIHFNPTTTERTGSSTSSRYRKSVYSWADGRLMETRTPDAATGTFEVVLKPGYPDFPAGGTYQGGTAADPSFSGTTGQAASVSFPADTPAGAMDMDVYYGLVEGWAASGISGATRLTRMQRSYVKQDGKWWEKRVTTTGSEDPSTTRESYSMTRLWQGSGSASISQNENGETVTTTTTYNPAAKETTTTTGRSGSAIPMIVVSVNGYVQWVQGHHSADPAHRAAYTYDAFGRVESSRDHRGAQTRTIYNALGQMEKSIDTLGRQTIHTYWPADSIAAGQVQTITWPDGKTSTYTYTARGELESVGGTSEYPVSYTYNEHGERESMTTTNAAGNSITRWEYNSAGLLKHKFYNWASGHGPSTPGTLIYTYDPFGRLLNQAVAGGKTTGYKNNIFGEVTEIDYGNDGAPDVILGRNAAGAPDVVTENYEGADGSAMGSGTTTHTYAAGRLDSVTYSQTHPYLPGVKLDYKDPDPATGSAQGYEVFQSAASQLDVSYGYDNEGRLKSVSSPQHGHFQYSYHPGSGVVAGYTRSTVPNGAATFEQSRHVDFQNRVSSVVTRKGSGEVLASVAYSYDKRDRRTQARREDGGYWSYGYNDRGEVTSATRHTRNDTSLNGFQRAYAYDDIGNRESADFGGGASGAFSRISYTVNGDNQYSGIDTPGKAWVVGKAPANDVVKVNGAVAGRQETWFFSELSPSNAAAPVKQSVSVTDGNDNPVTSGNLHIPKQSVSPEYDHAGNLVNDGIWVYEWDSMNRLRKMTPTTQATSAGFPNRVLEFVYDWQGRRIAKKVTEGAVVKHYRFLYEAWNPVAEWTASGANPGTTITLRQACLWGLDLAGQRNGETESLQGAGGVGGLLSSNLISQFPISNAPYFPSYDGNGNIIGWVSSDGSLAGRTEYDPFGNAVARESLANSDGSEWGFSTKYEDRETGLLYYGYRFYCPVTGRWPSRDPVEEQGGINLYYLAGNNGINKWDFLGQYTLSDAERTLKSRHVAPDIPASYTPGVPLLGGGIYQPASYSGEAVFNEWRRLEAANIGFWRGLEKCPLCINVKSGAPKNPDSKTWENPGKPTSWEEGLHPGAVWSMRSKAQNPGNQCIYDALGYIVLDANTHGTADLKKHGTNAHFENDVEPVILADMLDRGQTGKRMSVIWFLIRGAPYTPGINAYRVQRSPGPNTRKYIEVRSPW